MYASWRWVARTAALLVVEMDDRIGGGWSASENKYHWNLVRFVLAAHA